MVRVLLFVGFVSTVLVANWLVQTFGIVPVGFGLQAPAAVFVAGVAFLLRDALHEAAGRHVVVVAILVGAGLSLVISPAFAVASGLAFLVSEFVDFAVYTPLRERNLTAAVTASNVVGAVVDSVIFLSIAFGSLHFLPGQVVGKLWVTVAAVLVMAHLRRRPAVA